MIEAHTNICEKCNQKFRTCYRESGKKITLRKTRKFCLDCVPFNNSKPKLCAKCKNYFDTIVFINGKETSLYHRLHCLDCIPLGSGKGKRPLEKIKMKVCRLCNNKFPQSFRDKEKSYNLWHREICWECKPPKHQSPRKEKLICKKCGQEFLSKIVIDGEIKVFYNKKLCYDCLPVGSGSSIRYSHSDLEKTENGIKYKKCVKCERFLEANSNNFIGKDINKIVVKCRNCIYTRNKYTNRKRKENIVELKGGACNICGYKKCLNALEMHHKDPQKKSFNISLRNFSFNREEVIRELEKCLLLCSNCHREVHAGLHPSIL